MVDFGIKKASIRHEDLPYVNYDDTNLFYDVKYRIISEDKNRISHWSPIKRIIVPSTTDADLPYTTTPRILVYTHNVDTGKAITATWTFPQEASDFNPDPYKAELERRFSSDTEFDIFIRWSPDNTGTNWDPWKFEATISSNSYTLLRQESPYIAKRIEFVVQMPTLTKSVDSKLQLFRNVHTV